MHNKCTGPSKEESTSNGDLLVIDCNPLAPQDDADAHDASH